MSALRTPSFFLGVALIVVGIAVAVHLEIYGWMHPEMTQRLILLNNWVESLGCWAALVMGPFFIGWGLEK